MATVTAIAPPAGGSPRVMPRLSVIIPTLNEETTVTAAIESARDADHVEVIVADGGSADRTIAIAAALGARIVRSPPGRARQMNAAARAARGDTLLFLHADTLLPAGYVRRVEQLLSSPATVAGAFWLQIDSDQNSLRIHSAVTNLRSRLLGIPYGDQAIFVRRDVFRRVGGFPDLPVMEDLQFVQNLRRLGRVYIANQPVRTSDRRWRRHGTWRMTLLNQMLILAFYLGFDPVRLHRWRESGIILHGRALSNWCTRANWPSGGRMRRADGNDAVYESWVRDFTGNIYRCALRLCGQADTAEELTQEAFFEAWRSMHSLRDPDRARPWLLSILRHRYMHWLRDQKRRPDDSIAAQSQAEQMGSAEPLPGEALARQESLQAALNDLEDRYKLPLLLVFLEGFTCQQAAEFLDVPLGTVLSRVHRAKQFLRSRLGEDLPQQAHLRIHREQAEDRRPRSAGFGGAS